MLSMISLTDNVSHYVCL